MFKRHAGNVGVRLVLRAAGQPALKRGLGPHANTGKADFEWDVGGAGNRGAANAAIDGDTQAEEAGKRRSSISQAAGNKIEA
jgi:hypothetical protein